MTTRGKDHGSLGSGSESSVDSGSTAGSSSLSETPANESISDAKADQQISDLDRQAAQRRAAGVASGSELTDAKAQADTSTRKLDEAQVAGGVYKRADGTFQNANGQTVDEAGNVLDEEQRS